jgi:signal transduction histidine kinase
MSFFHYAPLLGAIFNFALSLFILGSDRRSRLNQLFAAWGVCIAIWNGGTWALFQATSASEAAAWAKAMQFGVIFLPVTMLHMTLELCGYRAGRWILVLYACHVALAVMNAFNLFINGARFVGYAYYSIAGPGFWIFCILFSQTWVSLLVLWHKRAQLMPRQRRRFNGIALAQTGILILGCNDLLPILGIEEYPLIGITIVPWGSLAAAAYGIMVAYSVFQHQLLDIRLALGRSSAYVVRFVFLVGIAIVLDVAVAALAPEGAITHFALLSSLAVLVVSTLLASFLFPKLLGGAAEDLERKLLGDHFEYQDQVRAFTERSRWHTELAPLLNELHSLLVNTLRVRAYWIILLDETNRAYSLVRAHPSQPQRQLNDLRADSPVFRYFLSNQAPFLALNPSDSRHDSTASSSAAREQLREFIGDIAFPLVVENQPLGILILGEKPTGEPFTRTDTQLLVALTENLALVINQISLKSQILVNEELDLLGRMSRGMAHDLNNLITPVWTMLQLLAEDVPAETLRTELAPVAMRNIQMMRSYIKEALFFSENLRPDFQLGRLDVLIEAVVEDARRAKRKGKDIKFTVTTNGEALVEMDQVLIQRLLANLISNGIDASSEGDEINVELIRLAKTDAARDWLRVRVSDHGGGIPSENLGRIFQPYFTTKKTGDENRGFGLGLVICRKIATLHGGNLTVQSDPGRGTAVNLDLPNRQKPAKSEPPNPKPVAPTPESRGT